ncbi:uncharacterized protein [Musca autumnalis]|uniref:uncharacterized protein n=1 Tax=Musca autumnalis TaxID=221902 RepID=UPI003CF6296B
MDTTAGDDINKLLKEWKLESISTHLQAEKVDMEVLEMIKLHHIRLLLGNYPLGIQIRFEHNLEKWRCKIGKPLYSGHRCFCQTDDFLCKKSFCNGNQKIVNPAKVKIQQQPLPADQRNAEIPSAATNNGLISTPPETPMTNRSLASISGSPTHSQASNGGGGGGVIEVADVTQNNTNFSSLFTLRPSQNIVPTTYLRELLLNTKPDGPMLLNIYETRQSFTDRERKRLINLIAGHFMSLEERLDLRTSYAFEKAIIRLFPNETIEMYRKGKRGRLYSRYSNCRQALLSKKERKRPRRDGNESASDMDSMSFNDHSANERDESSNVINAAFNELMNDDDDEPDEFLSDDGGEIDKSKCSPIKPKLEVDTDIPINTAYRLHREVIILKAPFSYKDFLEDACNVYNIPNVDDYYLAVNDCEINETEFKNVILQYYKLATFVVEVKQKTSIFNLVNFNSNENTMDLDEHTTIKQDPNYLPSAEEIRNLSSLVHIVAMLDLGKPLENKHRNAIAKAVVEECLRAQQDRCLQRQEFMILAQTICRAFPGEEESTYFIPSKPNVCAKGKLWSAFITKRTFLVQSGVAKKRLKRKKNTAEDSEDTQSIYSQETQAEELHNIDFSENTTMDWDYLMVKWTESHEKRWQELVKEKLTPSEYMERYSILRSEKGITLIEIDVKNRYPNVLTIDNWLNIYQKVLAKAKGIRIKLGNLESILGDIEGSSDERYNAGLSLLLIPYILPCRVRKNELVTSKASKADCQERFMKAYKSLDELRSDPNPADLQIRFVHHNHSVEYSEFSISGIVFQCCDLMEALSFLFHYMLAMNISYPQTCLQVWQFIQLAIFHIELEKDKRPCVESTIMDLRLY